MSRYEDQPSWDDGDWEDGEYTAEDRERDIIDVLHGVRMAIWVCACIAMLLTSWGQWSLGAFFGQLRFLESVIPGLWGAR